MPYVERSRRLPPPEKACLMATVGIAGRAADPTGKESHESDRGGQSTYLPTSAVAGDGGARGDCLQACAGARGAGRGVGAALMLIRRRIHRLRRLGSEGVLRLFRTAARVL